MQMIKMIKMIKNALPHICVILSGLFITFFIVDKFNAEMAFINNDASKLLLLLFCLVSVTVSSMMIWRNRREH